MTYQLISLRSISVKERCRLTIENPPRISSMSQLLEGDSLSLTDIVLCGSFDIQIMNSKKNKEFEKMNQLKSELNFSQKMKRKSSMK
jgi:hypothetical protein